MNKKKNMKGREPVKKEESPVRPSPVDTLIITGNGFDIWQELSTSYGLFEKYYFEHRDEILEQLGLSRYWIVSGEGEDDGHPAKETAFGDVEMIYGDPFDPNELCDDFWFTFESSLSQLDSERLNLFFGKEEDDLNDLKTSAQNARRVLRKAFCDWIGTVEIDAVDAGYRFGDNCLIVNFNYTDTLEKRFAVPSENIFHIHGAATDPDSIVFGHALHPQKPVKALYCLGGRFRGLYFIENALYETDKHAYSHYLELLKFLAVRGVRLSDIRHIYVLGHSFGSADMEYFRELSDKTGGKQEPEEIKDFWGIDSWEADHLAIGYTILTYGNDGLHPEIDAEKVLAYGQYMYHQQKDALWRSTRNAYRRRESDRNIYPYRFRDLNKVLASSPEAAPAKWHVSYHKEADKTRIEQVLRMIGVQAGDYTLYDSIDQCLADFRQ